ncbi:MAG TPA: DUF3443 domain-containing protein [Casimicrobiaceae bacterium]
MRALWRGAPPLAPLLAALLCLSGCGGGGGGGSSSSSPPPAVQNTLPMTVDGGPEKFANLGFVSVTICSPGSGTNCQTIDHIQVDTGSSGLRIIASVLSPALALPQQTDSAGNALAECAQFVDGFSWGSVRIADIRLAGEQASSVPIQLIGDPSFPTIPASCSNSGPPENTVATFGANGLLGIGVFVQDCGPACVQSAIPGTYYSCAAGGCVPTQTALAKQLQNPVALFATDNNGVVLQFPAVPSTGLASVTGSLTIGIGTQADNGLGGAQVLMVDANSGNFVTSYNGRAYPNSYIDAGSSLLFFEVSAFPLCTGAAGGLYCPATTQNLGATLQGVNAVNANVNFSVANADQVVAANPSFFAFPNLAAPSGDRSTFDWGLPFFFGRTVFIAIEGRSTPGGTGPYVAF